MADMNAANEALRAGDFTKAVEEFKRLAERGDIKAQSHLGYMYYAGEGVSQSYEEAVKWYRMAASQGDRDAQYNLAVAYAFGEGVKQDFREAALWYRRAAEQGHAVAQYSLGISYAYGEGVPQDEKEAAGWFLKSAEQGYERAEVMVASLYHTGEGLGKDYEKAAAWYRKAAGKGNASAQYNLGTLYRAGKGVPRDYDQAVQWFRLAADQGYVAAQNELSSMERAIAGAINEPPQATTGDAAPTDTTTATPAAKAEEETEPVPGVPAVSETVTPSPPALPEDKTEAPAVAATPPEPPGAGEESGGVAGFFQRLFSGGEKKPDSAVPEPQKEAPAFALTEIQTPYRPRKNIAPPAAAIASTPEHAAEPEEKTAAISYAEGLSPADEQLTPATEEIPDHPDPTGADIARADQPITSPGAAEGTSPEAPASPSETADETSTVTQMEDPERREGLFARLFRFGKKSTPSPQPDAGGDDTEAVAAEEEPAKADVLPTVEWDSQLAEPEAPERLPEETADQAADQDLQIALADQKPATIGETVEVEDALDTAVTTAADSLLPLAVEGDADAQYRLATLYYEGVNVEQDFNQAFLWYRRAAIQGMVDAQYKLGNMYLMGEGIAQNDREARDWYEKAAAQGHTGAQHNLESLRVALAESGDPATGTVQETSAEVDEETSGGVFGFIGGLFGAGDEEPDQPAVAAPLPASPATGVKRADTPAVPAQTDYERGMAYAYGDGVARNTAMAVKYFEHAASQGYAPAQYQLGLAYANGEGLSQDPLKALEWFRKAALQGHTIAQRSLGHMYLNGEGVPQNKPLAFAWYSILAEQGNVLDIHRRDTLKSQLSESELEEAVRLKQDLIATLSTASTAF